MPQKRWLAPNVRTTGVGNGRRREGRVVASLPSSPLSARRRERRETLADALRAKVEEDWEDEDSENKRQALERSCASCTSLGRVWGLRVTRDWDRLAPGGRAYLDPSILVHSSRGTEESRFAKASLLANTQEGEGNRTNRYTNRHWCPSRGTGPRGRWSSKKNWSKSNKDGGCDRTRDGCHCGTGPD